MWSFSTFADSATVFTKGVSIVITVWQQVGVLFDKQNLNSSMCNKPACRHSKLWCSITSILSANFESTYVCGMLISMECLLHGQILGTGLLQK